MAEQPPAKRRREGGGENDDVQLKGQLTQCSTIVSQSLQNFKQPVKKENISGRTATMLRQITDLKRVVRGSFEKAFLASTKSLDEKQTSDQLHLQLQNILYEKNHVEKEIQRCENFRSQHEDISLEEEDKNKIVTDAHSNMLDRLDRELQERKRLQLKFRKLTAEKESIATSNIEKKKNLAQLPSQLNAVLKAVEPLKKYIGNPNEKVKTTAASAEAYLPPPMYTLFVFLAEYRKVHGGVEVNVIGSKSTAKHPATVAEWEPKEKEDAMDVEEDEGDDFLLNDDAKNDDDDESRRSKTDKTSTTDKTNKLLELHPLKIKLQLTSPQNGGRKLVIEFAYLTQLNTVTVFDRSLSSLSCLYPNDVGNELPSISAAMVAQSHGLLTFEDKVAQCGRPYRWAQVIAGIEDINVESDTVLKRTTHRSLLQVVERIKNNLRAQQSLGNQIASLQSGTIQVDVSASKLFPKAATATVAKWKKNEAASSAILHVFDCTLKRGSVELAVSVAVSLVYPVVAPKFTLQTTASGDSQLAFDSTNLRAMEKEVNVFCDELTSTDPAIADDMLLTNQFRRLQMCFDVYCDLMKASNSATYPRGCRGKDRLRPYKFDHESNQFEHR